MLHEQAAFGMELTRANQRRTPHASLDQLWWLRADDLCKKTEQLQPLPIKSALYRIGDAVLQVSSDDASVLQSLAQMYGDCAVSGALPPAKPLVHCVVRSVPDLALLLITFLEGGPADPAQAFLPTSAMRAWDSPLPGWRLIGRSTTPILAACRTKVLIDVRNSWPEFPVQCLVSAMLAAQSGLVAVHAASLATRGAGLVLVGPSHAGKSTTALHLAARGFTLLGDDVALIQLVSNDLLPFPRTANLRPGPRSPELARLVEDFGGGEACVIEGEPATRLRIRKLFSDQHPLATPLAAVFFLDGFSNPPSVLRIEPKLHELQTTGFFFPGNLRATLWRMTSSRRAMHMMAIRRLLERTPCWRLKLGAPGDTAELIERTMENL